MSQQMMWLTIILMGVLTYGLRISFIVLAGRVDLPVTIRRILNYAPSAVLFALIIPSILVRQQAIAIHLGNERIWAALIAAAIAWKTHNIFATITIGMVALWLLQLVLP